MHRTKTRTLARMAPAVTLIGLAALQTGCSSSELAGLRANPSPELFSRTRTMDQELNNFALLVNRDFRSATDDLKRTLLLERPSRMNPAPNPW